MFVIDVENVIDSMQIVRAKHKIRTKLFGFLISLRPKESNKNSIIQCLYVHKIIYHSLCSAIKVQFDATPKLKVIFGKIAVFRAGIVALYQ